MMISVVRHGRTAANAARLLQGRIDNPLDDFGRDQAARVAAALGRAEVPVDRIVSSPLSRARSTAEPLAAALAARRVVEIDDRWIELDYGDWEGRAIADVSASEWEHWRADVGFAPPGGESLAEVNERVRDACADIAADPRGEHVAVFTHMSPVKAAVGWTVDWPADQTAAPLDLSWRLHVAPAQITTIGFNGDTPILLAFNDTAHLRA
ncbi:MAG TPA: histidine phosphatase family protein [Acidimicrobiaceae bacterium]|nr:histidine phosphatase family protein [Acidimicrobiaceae bacterium]